MTTVVSAKKKEERPERIFRAFEQPGKLGGFPKEVMAKLKSEGMEEKTVYAKARWWEGAF